MTESNKTYYTQRDWDRTVGYGRVPEKYQYPKDYWKNKFKESKQKVDDAKSR